MADALGCRSALRRADAAGSPDCNRRGRERDQLGDGACRRLTRLRSRPPRGHVERRPAHPEHADCYGNPRRNLCRPGDDRVAYESKRYRQQDDGKGAPPARVRLRKDIAHQSRFRHLAAGTFRSGALLTLGGASFSLIRWPVLYVRSRWHTAGMTRHGARLRRVWPLQIRCRAPESPVSKPNLTVRPDWLVFGEVQQTRAKTPENTKTRGIGVGRFARVRGLSPAFP